MPQNVTQYDLLISCPGDVKKEVNIIKDAIEQFNELYSDSLNISIRPRYWKASSFPQSGGHAQNLLNNQFVNDCDAAVAIFWTRFGSPTDEYESGTEEEIELMLASKKQVFMYFSDVPAAPSSIDNAQYKLIQEFREKYADQGIYSTYSSLTEFKTKFFAHLSQYFLSQQRVEKLIHARKPELIIMGIDENDRLSEKATIAPFVLNNHENKESYIARIRRLYGDIAEMTIPEKAASVKNTNNSSLGLAFKGNPVEIDEKEKSVIQVVAEKLGIKIGDGFFSLGDLRYSIIPTDMYGGRRIEGDKIEKEKYSKLRNLLETINDLFRWLQIEQAFSDFRCIKLCLGNRGTAVDEDIEVVLSFPPNSIVTVKDFPEFENSTEGYLLNECDMETLFGICGTHEYYNYHNANKEKQRFYSSAVSLPGQTPDYESDYHNELSNIFSYLVYDETDKTIIKIKFQYIKHNTFVAFPTPFMMRKIVDSIPYSITSKNIEGPVNGSIEVITNKSDNDN